MTRAIWPYVLTFRFTNMSDRLHSKNVGKQLCRVARMIVLYIVMDYKVTSWLYSIPYILEPLLLTKQMVEISCYFVYIIQLG